MARFVEDAPSPSLQAEVSPTVPKRHQDDLLIVGIGASAGGLAAFKLFFSRLPPVPGMAFVLIQHLDPSRPSMLVELLRSKLALPIEEAKDGTVIAANHVYAIPPDATLTVSGGILHVTQPAPPRQTRRPIDTFFTSLAQDQGNKAVAIVLSGVGSDGTSGVMAIKEHGGLTLAQREPGDGPLAGMPKSAANSGHVDHVMLVEEMPDWLLGHRRYVIETPHAAGDVENQPDLSERIKRIAAILHAHTGHDFAGYKTATLVRRIERRMQVLQVETMNEYMARLKLEPGEADKLFADLLIGVTEFFRNASAFECLQSVVIPKLLALKGSEDRLRVWVAGCASGEEVYSIAILLNEALTVTRTATNITIFGTDIDTNAIAFARAARYPKAAVQALSPERLARWFVPQGNDFCPIRSIRDMCVFSTHSLIKDPPFSKLDLISCRNVLIYLNSDLQHRIMQTFHYALSPGGYLFLGPSESATRETDLFTAIDKKHRLFVRLENAPRESPALLPAAAGRQKKTPLPKAREDDIVTQTRRALEKFVPAHFVIDAGNEIVRFSGSETRHYIEPSSGAPNLNLFSMIRKDLRAQVRTALHRARAERTHVITENLTVKVDGQNRRCA